MLSLDFRGDAFQGPDEILAEPTLWPRRIIVMSLARVERASSRAGRRDPIGRRRARIYAAGGVRDAVDLSALKAAGAVDALIATALHDGRIGRADLEAI